MNRNPAIVGILGGEEKPVVQEIRVGKVELDLVEDLRGSSVVRHVLLAGKVVTIPEMKH